MRDFGRYTNTLYLVFQDRFFRFGADVALLSVGMVTPCSCAPHSDPHVIIPFQQKTAHLQRNSQVVATHAAPLIAEGEDCHV